MSFSFDSHAELVVVPAEIRGPKGSGVAWLALDTAATSSLVSWDFLAAIGYEPSKQKSRIRITTGSGVEYVPVVRVRRIVTLGQTVERFAFLCHNLPPSATVDGLLGLDFLRGRRLQLDFRKGLIKLS